MKRWNYRILELEEEKEIEWLDKLNRWGDERCEMVALVAHHTRNTYWVFFKEPVE